LQFPDRFDELAIFVAIVDTGSLTAAARRLQRSPPAVSRTLAALEQRLGTRLIERSTRRLATTDAGRRLAEQARRLVGEYEEALREVTDENAELRGVLRVTAPMVFGRLHVMPAVSRFLDVHPALRVELLLSDRYLDLIDEGLDVAIRIGRLADSRLMSRRVGEVTRVLVASPAYVAANGMPRAPDELTNHAIIFTTGRSTPIEWRFRTGTRERAVHLAPRLLVNQVDAALLAAREGRGIASALSYQVADDLAKDRLLRLLGKFEREPEPVQLVTSTARLMPRRVRAFIDYAAAALTSSLKRQFQHIDDRSVASLTNQQIKAPSTRGRK
jgi:DNA-binding transcriptional LysR family regulator